MNSKHIKNYVKFFKFDLYILYDGYYKCDAGSAFGIVPKMLWRKFIEFDENNLMNVRISPLLIKTGNKNILIETGFGNKFKENERIKKVWNSIVQDRTLLDSLKDINLTPEDIDIVILTHLHFDHTGGSTIFNEKNNIVPTFPKAKYFIQKREWKNALNPHILGKNSYYLENYEPLQRHGCLELIDGNTIIYPGVETMVIGGHIDCLQLVKIESEGQIALFFSDLVPTIAHVKPVWNPAFDLDPLKSSLMKKKYLEKAIKEHWLLIWYHDMKTGMGYLKEDWKVYPIVKFN